MAKLERCVICLSQRRCAHVRQHPCRGNDSQTCGPSPICVPCTERMVENFKGGSQKANGQFCCPICLARLGPRRRALEEGSTALAWAPVADTPNIVWKEHPMQAAVRKRNVQELQRLSRVMLSSEVAAAEPEEADAASSAARESTSSLEEAEDQVKGKGAADVHPDDRSTLPRSPADMGDVHQDDGHSPHGNTTDLGNPTRAASMEADSGSTLVLGTGNSQEESCLSARLEEVSQPEDTRERRAQNCDPASQDGAACSQGPRGSSGREASKDLPCSQGSANGGSQSEVDGFRKRRARGRQAKEMLLPLDSSGSAAPSSLSALYAAALAPAAGKAEARQASKEPVQARAAEPRRGPLEAVMPVQEMEVEATAVPTLPAQVQGAGTAQVQAGRAEKLVNAGPPVSLAPPSPPEGRVGNPERAAPSTAPPPVAPDPPATASAEEAPPAVSSDTHAGDAPPTASSACKSPRRVPAASSGPTPASALGESPLAGDLLSRIQQRKRRRAAVEAAKWPGEAALPTVHASGSGGSSSSSSVPPLSDLSQSKSKKAEEQAALPLSGAVGRSVQKQALGQENQCPNAAPMQEMPEEIKDAVPSLRGGGKQWARVLKGANSDSSSAACGKPSRVAAVGRSIADEAARLSAGAAREEISSTPTTSGTLLGYGRIATSGRRDEPGSCPVSHEIGATEAPRGSSDRSANPAAEASSKHSGPGQARRMPEAPISSSQPASSPAAATPDNKGPEALCSGHRAASSSEAELAGQRQSVKGTPEAASLVRRGRAATFNNYELPQDAAGAMAPLEAACLDTDDTIVWMPAEESAEGQQAPPEGALHHEVAGPAASEKRHSTSPGEGATAESPLVASAVSAPKVSKPLGSSHRQDAASCLDQQSLRSNPDLRDCSPPRQSRPPAEAKSPDFLRKQAFELAQETLVDEVEESGRGAHDREQQLPAETAGAKDVMGPASPLRTAEQEERASVKLPRFIEQTPWPKRAATIHVESPLSLRRLTVKAAQVYDAKLGALLEANFGSIYGAKRKAETSEGSAKAAKVGHAGREAQQSVSSPSSCSQAPGHGPQRCEETLPEAPQPPGGKELPAEVQPHASSPRVSQPSAPEPPRQESDVPECPAVRPHVPTAAALLPQTPFEAPVAQAVNMPPGAEQGLERPPAQQSPQAPSADVEETLQGPSISEAVPQVSAKPLKAEVAKPIGGSMAAEILRLQELTGPLDDKFPILGSLVQEHLHLQQTSIAIPMIARDLAKATAGMTKVLEGLHKAYGGCQGQPSPSKPEEQGQIEMEVNGMETVLVDDGNGEVAPLAVVAEPVAVRASEPVATAEHAASEPAAVAVLQPVADLPAAAMPVVESLAVPKPVALPDECELHAPTDLGHAWGPSSPGSAGTSSTEVQQEQEAAAEEEDPVEEEPEAVEGRQEPAEQEPADGQQTPLEEQECDAAGMELEEAEECPASPVTGQATRAPEATPLVALAQAERQGLRRLFLSEESEMRLEAKRPSLLKRLQSCEAPRSPPMPAQPPPVERRNSVASVVSTGSTASPLPLAAEPVAATPTSRLPSMAEEDLQSAGPQRSGSSQSLPAAFVLPESDYQDEQQPYWASSPVGLPAESPMTCPPHLQRTPTMAQAAASADSVPRPSPLLMPVTPMEGSARSSASTLVTPWGMPLEARHATFQRIIEQQPQAPGPQASPLLLPTTPQVAAARSLQLRQAPGDQGLQVGGGRQEASDADTFTVDNSLPLPDSPAEGEYEPTSNDGYSLYVAEDEPQEDMGYATTQVDTSLATAQPAEDPVHSAPTLLLGDTAMDAVETAPAGQVPGNEQQKAAVPSVPEGPQCKRRRLGSSRGQEDLGGAGAWEDLEVLAGARSTSRHSQAAQLLLPPPAAAPTPSAADAAASAEALVNLVRDCRRSTPSSGRPSPRLPPSGSSSNRSTSRPGKASAHPPKGRSTQYRAPARTPSLSGSLQTTPTMVTTLELMREARLSLQ